MSFCPSFVANGGIGNRTFMLSGARGRRMRAFLLGSIMIGMLPCF